MVGSHWPTLAASSHLVEPHNSLKQLKIRSQWGFSQAFPLMMIKVILPFIQTKANLKITICLTPWGPKPLLLTKNQSLRAPQTLYKTFSSAHKGTSHVLPTNLNFRAKAYLANQQSHNSKAWGWKYRYRGTFPLFLTTSLNFLLQVTVGWNFKPVEPRFPHRAETWEQKPTELGNILTILNLRDGNMGIGEPSLSSSQPLSISSSGWLWVEISDLLCFYTFSTLLLLALLFSFVKAPLTFCSL